MPFGMQIARRLQIFFAAICLAACLLALVLTRSDATISFIGSAILVFATGTVICTAVDVVCAAFYRAGPRHSFARPIVTALVTVGALFMLLTAVERILPLLH